MSQFSAQEKLRKCAEKKQNINREQVTCIYNQFKRHFNDLSTYLYFYSLLTCNPLQSLRIIKLKVVAFQTIFMIIISKDKHGIGNIKTP